MAAALVITIRFLDGRYHGKGDWPPSPARLFQALVAGAATGPRLDAPAREALGWLETLAPPVIAAPPARQVHPVKYWVPNNDVDARLDAAKGGYAEAVADVRTARVEQPWLFDAARPLHYVWDLPEGCTPPAGLADVVHALFRLGRGTDPAFGVLDCLDAGEAMALLDDYPGALHRPGPGTDSATPCPGTLASLETRHAAFLGRFSWAGRQVAFSQPPKPRVRLVGYEARPRRMVYELRRVDAARAFRPVPLTEAAPLTGEVLAQAAERLIRALPSQEALIRRYLLGTGAGAAEKPGRVRLVPLPSAGHAHTDPSIRRLLLEMPPACPLAPGDLDWALGALDPYDPGTGEIRNWRLVRGSGSDTVLRHYTGSSQRWRSVTPVVLPRRGRERDRRSDTEAAAGALRQALRHAGIRALPAEIRIQPEPLHRRGARAEAFVRPDYLRDGRQAVHAEIRFEAPLSGPVLIGDGRYRGLGLFEPVREDHAVFLFALGGDDPIDAETVAAAARRAVMARAQQQVGRAALPSFFTGHAAEGDPLRAGGRAHLGISVDPEARHLLIATPQALDHRAPTADEARQTATLAAALAGFDRLVAGLAGAFDLVPVQEGDTRLIGPARAWRSITDWTPCRHGKGDPADWIAADLRAECLRRGLPEPAVAIEELTQGRRGAIRARLRLDFAIAIRGPVALGRSAMKGGGVFVAAG